MKKIFILVVILIISTTFEISAQSFKVIINKSNSASSLSAKEVSSIFLKKLKKWDDGTAIIPVDLNANSAVRVNFSKSVHKKSVGAIRSYWQQAIFSGAGTAPMEKGSDADVVAFVKSNPGAIGYVSVGANVSGVKVLKVD